MKCHLQNSFRCVRDWKWHFTKFYIIKGETNRKYLNGIVLYSWPDNKFTQIVDKSCGGLTGHRLINRNGKLLLISTYSANCYCSAIAECTLRWASTTTISATSSVDGGPPPDGPTSRPESMTPSFPSYWWSNRSALLMSSREAAHASSSIDITLSWQAFNSLRLNFETQLPQAKTCLNECTYNVRTFGEPALFSSNFFSWYSRPHLQPPHPTPDKIAGAWVLGGVWGPDVASSFKLQALSLSLTSLLSLLTSHFTSSVPTHSGFYSAFDWIGFDWLEKLQRYLSLCHQYLYLSVTAFHLIVFGLCSSIKLQLVNLLSASPITTTRTIWIPPHNESYSTIHLDCCTFLVSRFVIASTALRSFWFKIDTCRNLMSLSVISFSQACVVLPPKPNHPEKCITMILNFRHAIHHVPRELTR